MSYQNLPVRAIGTLAILIQFLPFKYMPSDNNTKMVNHPHNIITHLVNSDRGRDFSDIANCICHLNSDRNTHIVSHVTSIITQDTYGV